MDWQGQSERDFFRFCVWILIVPSAWTSSFSYAKWTAFPSGPGPPDFRPVNSWVLSYQETHYREFCDWLESYSPKDLGELGELQFLEARFYCGALGLVGCSNGVGSPAERSPLSRCYRALVRVSAQYALKGRNDWRWGVCQAHRSRFVFEQMAWIPSVGIEASFTNNNYCSNVIINQPYIATNLL